MSNSSASASPQVSAVIKDSIGSIQDVMANTMKGLNSSVQQSLQMVQSMNSMMEAMLLQSLTIDFEFDKGNSGINNSNPSISVNLYNRSQLPLSGIALEFTLDSHQQHVSVLKSGGAGGKPITFDLRPLSTKKGATVLNLCYRCCDSSTINHANLGDISGNIALTVKSPGTGNTLKKHVPVRISKVQQLTFHFTPNSEAAANFGFVEQYFTGDKVDLVYLRKLLNVPAFEALRCTDEGTYTGVFIDNKSDIVVTRISLHKDCSLTVFAKTAKDANDVYDQISMKSQAASF